MRMISFVKKLFKKSEKCDADAKVRFSYSVEDNIKENLYTYYQEVLTEEKRQEKVQKFHHFLEDNFLKFAEERADEHIYRFRDLIKYIYRNIAIDEAKKYRENT